MADPVLEKVARKGRGAVSNITGRYEPRSSEATDDGWASGERFDDALNGIVGDPERPARDGRAGGSESNRNRAMDGVSKVQEPPALQTTVLPEKAKSIITTNQSPDISFSQSINPYRGCEHGCIYCYARPAHAYVNLSPGLDFETRLFYKENAAALLEQELRKPRYKCSMISLGANTDPYQPIERKYRVTRSILEVLDRYNHPVGIVTKGAALLERDLDILSSMARRNLAMVFISITSLKDELKRTLEPRTSGPAARLRLIKKVAQAGIPVGTMFAPVIPFINDSELERVLEAAQAAGAEWAGYVMLRLPHEVAPLFREWLATHAPLKAEHVMSLVQQMRGGNARALNDQAPAAAAELDDFNQELLSPSGLAPTQGAPRSLGRNPYYSAEWGTRHRGEGAYADMIAQRFQLACKRLGLNRKRRTLDIAQFRPPVRAGDQMTLAL